MVGEVAYQRSKERQAFAWIDSHKRRFLLLTVKRFRLFWVPNMRRPWQSVFEAALTFVGLCGLVRLFWSRAAFAWAVSAVFIAYPAVYYVIQVSPRYRFPLEPILLLLAANLFFCTLRNCLKAPHHAVSGPETLGEIPGRPYRGAPRQNTRQLASGHYLVRVGQVF
jgi:hypothetical protein